MILLSHLGRPKAAPELKYSLRPVAEALAVHLGRPVGFCEEAVGAKADAAVSALEPGEILLLENVRFYPGEERGDADFAAQLAQHGDCYVNDAFGTAHRAHASTTIVAQHFPGQCAFGYVMAAEIENVNRVLQSNERPTLAIVGGSKVSSKIDILQRLMDRVDHIIIGGGMSFTFIKAQGGQVGRSICELDHLQTAARHHADGTPKRGDVCTFQATCWRRTTFRRRRTRRSVPFSTFPPRGRAWTPGPRIDKGLRRGCSKGENPLVERAPRCV